METIHFTELKDHAVRQDQIQRGLRYLVCHDSRDDPYNFAGSAFASEKITASHIQFKSSAVWVPPSLDSDRDHPHYFMVAFLYHLSWDPERRLEWCAVESLGLLADDGRRTNSSNYVLEVNALLREGIVIDTTHIPRKPGIPSWHDYMSH